MNEAQLYRLLAYAVAISILMQFAESVDLTNARNATLAVLQAAAHSWIVYLYRHEYKEASQRRRRKVNGTSLLLHLMAGAVAIATLIMQGLAECSSAEHARNYFSHFAPLAALELTVIFTTAVKSARWAARRLQGAEAKRPKRSL
jgi:hypothetical protein